mmetsp:Transcript_29772/g.97435  ORF Transcript_29772/g.97435 Transcript_29772/m.97435 type:complete len:236 (+) Transcript_29772:1128-1835(+)
MPSLAVAVAAVVVACTDRRCCRPEPVASGTVLGVNADTATRPLKATETTSSGALGVNVVLRCREEPLSIWSMGVGGTESVSLSEETVVGGNRSVVPSASTLPTSAELDARGRTTLRYVRTPEPGALPPPRPPPPTAGHDTQSSRPPNARCVSSDAAANDRLGTPCLDPRTAKRRNRRRRLSGPTRLHSSSTSTTTRTADDPSDVGDGAVLWPAAASARTLRNASTASAAVAGHSR